MIAFLAPFLAGWSLVKGVYGMMPDWLKKALAALVILALVFAAGDQRGKRIARAQCEAQAQRAQKAADAQDLQAERDGRAQDLEITDTLTRQKKVDDARIIALEKQVAGSQIARGGKSDPCLYDRNNADPSDAPSRMRH